MMTPPQLNAFMVSLETAAGATTTGNSNESGRWKRIAAAAEALAGETSNANDNLQGYRLRTAVALEVLAETTGTEENRNESGLLKRIVDALDALNGTTGAGSLGYRIMVAADTAEQEGNFGGANEPETDALLARFSSAPDATRVGHINDLIVALKAAGVWAKLDALYVLAAHDEQAGQRNWIADAFNLVPTAGAGAPPAFTVDEGYVCNGSDNYLDTGFNPTAQSATAKYVQNSAHVSIWRLSDVTPGTRADVGATTLLGVASFGTAATGSVNSAPTGIGSGSTATITDGIGHTIFNRSGSNTLEFYKNGADIATTGDDASSGIPNSNITIGARLGGPAWSAAPFAAASIGQSLSAGEAAAFHAALATYMTPVGA